jgi:predicted PurR-regulated permease PerM
MNPTFDPDFEQRLASRLLDVLVRGALILALGVLCYRTFAPFLGLMAWGLIFAVTLLPLHQKIADRVGQRQGLASLLIVAAGIVLIVIPTVLLLNSLGDSVHQLVDGVKDNTLRIPPPPPGVADWPLLGSTTFATWTMAHNDLPGLVASLQPKIGDLTRSALAGIASIGGAVLQMFLAFLLAGLLMAYAEAGGADARAAFQRAAGKEKGGEFAELCAATIRSVAVGVLGVALIQAIISGLCMLVARVPFAGALALAILVLAILQVPCIVVILPVIAYIWKSGDYGAVAATTYTALLLASGLADNVLKPLLLGRGVKAPMPVILIGALGGMASSGIMGMFVGATMLALGYQLFMAWVRNDPDSPAPSGLAESVPTQGDEGQPVPNSMASEP